MLIGLRGAVTVRKHSSGGGTVNANASLTNTSTLNGAISVGLHIALSATSTLAANTTNSIVLASPQPILVQYAGAGSAFSNPVTVTLPSAPTAGNTLIAFAGINGQYFGAPTFGYGTWKTEVSNNGYGTVPNASLWFSSHVVQGGDSATITCNPSGDVASFIIAEVSGLPANGIYDPAGIQIVNGNTSSPSYASLTPVTTNDLVMSWITLNDNYNAADPAPGTGWTSVLNQAALEYHASRLAVATTTPTAGTPIAASWGSVASATTYVSMIVPFKGVAPANLTATSTLNNPLPGLGSHVALAATSTLSNPVTNIGAHASLTATNTISGTASAGSAPTITTSTLNTMTKSTAFSQTPATSGGTPTSWAITVGSLPTGLSISSTTGAITGTPTIYGVYSFTVTATNSAGSGSQAYTGNCWNVLLTPPSGMTSYNFSTISASIGSTDLAVVVNNMPGSGALILDTPGTYSWSGFNGYVSTGSCFALGVFNPNCKAILGSTPNPSDTIVTMVTNSSTFPTADIPADGSGQTNNITAIRVPMIGNLTYNATTQGHLYNGIQINNDDSPSTSKYLMDNLIVTGVPGDANTPPGETAAISILEVKGTSGAHYTVGANVESSGLRHSDGALVGASVFEWNSSAFIDNIGVSGGVDGPGVRQGNYFHDTISSMPSYFTCNDMTTTNLYSARCGSGGGSLSGCGINHEESTRITHTTPTLIVSNSSADFQHIGVASQNFDCTVAIISPLVDHPAYESGTPSTTPIAPSTTNKFLCNIPSVYGSGEQVTGTNVTVNGTSVNSSSVCQVFH